MAEAPAEDGGELLQRESSGEEVEAIAESKVGRPKARSRDTVREASFLRRPECAIVGRQDIDGITWYTVQVRENGEERSYSKRYSDFKVLHKRLMASKTAVREVPPLPTGGVLGFRHRLDVGGFNDQRQQALQELLVALLAQVSSVAQEAALDDFFARETAAHIDFGLAANDRLKSLQNSILEHMGSPCGSGSTRALRTSTDVGRCRQDSFYEKDRIGEGGDTSDTLAVLAADGVGLTCRKGKKDTQPNQDSMCILRQEDTFSAFGVFDGHGPFGHDVSNFVASYIMKLFGGHKVRDTMPEEALRFAFIETQNMLDELTLAGEINATVSGSTGSVVVLDADRTSVYVAHVGDSRAVLCRSHADDAEGGVAVDLTEDHRPTIEKEQSRIEAAGGIVEFDGMFNHRVWTADRRGGLCVSRVLGDGMLHGAGVIAVPETSQATLGQEGKLGRGLFVLLCSDGVWEFFSSQDACNIVLKHGRSGVQGAAKELAQLSRNYWLQDSEGEVTDDITVIIVWL